LGIVALREQLLPFLDALFVKADGVKLHFFFSSTLHWFSKLIVYKQATEIFVIYTSANTFATSF
jgi:hypothetical protein